MGNFDGMSHVRRNRRRIAFTLFVRLLFPRKIHASREASAPGLIGSAIDNPGADASRSPEFAAGFGRSVKPSPLTWLNQAPLPMTNGPHRLTYASTVSLLRGLSPLLVAPQCQIRDSGRGSPAATCQQLAADPHEIACSRRAFPTFDSFPTGPRRKTAPRSIGAGSLGGLCDSWSRRPAHRL